MLPEEQRLKELFFRHLHDALHSDEQQEFYSLALKEDLQPALKQWIDDQWNDIEGPVGLSDERAAAILRLVLSENKDKRTLVVRVLQQKWLRVAAIFLLLVLGSIFLYRAGNKKPDQQYFTAENIHPGKNAAKLTLSDGRTILLDSVGNKVILDESGAKVILVDGELKYEMNHSADQQDLSHTITTERGNQFQLKLPDGTRVWLNAASSITYPLRFADDKRTVSVTGEAYFEVEKLSSGKPFIVNSPLQKITVLGTHFNVNTYEGNGGTITTLIEGKVSVGGLYSTEQKILHPGQQSVVKNDQEVKVQDAGDLDQVLAWHKGYFYFTNTRFSEIMKQLSRWYDIDIQYETKIPEVEFEGKLNRSVTLAQVLAFLKDSGIRFKLENKTLYIL